MQDRDCEARSAVILFLIGALIGSAVPSFAAAAETKAEISKAKARVTILRDEFGVPHVFASTERSLWYGVGYAQGQDRLWQAEILRRTARGTLAEIYGADVVAGDKMMRTVFGSAERYSALLESASVQVRSALEAFAAGMNDWIDEVTATGQLPIEFTAFDCAPEHWVEEDSLAILSLLLFMSGETGGDEAKNHADLQYLTHLWGPVEAAKVFADTHWLNDRDAPTTIPAEEGSESLHRCMEARTESPTAILGNLPDVNAAWAALRSNFAHIGLKPGPASNAIVIGPDISADGRALLLGGPQMGYATPQIYHEIGIHRAGMNATGTMIAGVPLMQIGVSNEYAWTVTAGGTDNTDMYVEWVNPENSSQYQFDGQWLDFECRQEIFVVRGNPDETKIICETDHGPVLETTPEIAVTLKRAVRGFEMTAYETFFVLPAARSVSDVDTALASFPACLNFFYADKRGNIAYWHTGRIPIRAEGDDPWLLHDGRGSAEWQGFIPWEEMPHITNPAQGWLSSWNNKPAPGWDNSAIDFWNWGPVHRVNTLNNRLSRLPPRSATVETLEELNKIGGWTADTPSGSAENVFVSTLLGKMLARVNPEGDPRLEDVVPLLEGWDWQQLDLDPMDWFYDSPGVAIFNTWWQRWVDRVFADDLGNALLPNGVANLTYRMLAEDPAVSLLHDYLGGETVAQAMTESLIAALDDLTAEYGSAEIHRWLQPVVEIVWKPIGIVDVPTTIWMNRGTYNQIVHLGPGPEMYGQNVVAPGQSGDPVSPHFEDQLVLYFTWTYKPMRLTVTDIENFAELRLVLKPGR